MTRLPFIFANLLFLSCLALHKKILHLSFMKPSLHGYIKELDKGDSVFGRTPQIDFQ